MSVYLPHLSDSVVLFGSDLTSLFSNPPQVNIIPIIAKADTISKSELHKFKIKIMSELVSNGVQIYQFPTDDEAVSEINASMNVRPGFCPSVAMFLMISSGT